MPRITRDDIKVNQKFLKRWDKYQLGWLNDPNFTKNKPLFMPMTVNIGGGIIQRRRIKGPELETLMAKSGSLSGLSAVADAVSSYLTYFDDDNQSATPPETALDFNINCPVVHLFYLPRENWKFTDHTQFSVDNVPPGLADNQLYEVLGTFDDDRALLVMNHNWTPEVKKTNWMKYNLHVSIFQDVDAFDENDNLESRRVRTDIIIDPGGNADDGNTGRSGG